MVGNGVLVVTSVEITDPAAQFGNDRILIGVAANKSACDADLPHKLLRLHARSKCGRPGYRHVEGVFSAYLVYCKIFLLNLFFRIFISASVTEIVAGPRMRPEAPNIIMPPKAPMSAGTV